jgi:hypothetical protein
MTNNVTAVRWAVLVALMLFTVAMAGVITAGGGHAGIGPAQVLTLADDPDEGGQ